MPAIDREKAGIVEMRCFGGMSHQEIAEVTGSSEPNVIRTSGVDHFGAEAVPQVPFDELPAGIAGQGVFQEPDITG